MRWVLLQVTRTNWRECFASAFFLSGCDNDQNGIGRGQDLRKQLSFSAVPSDVELRQARV